jgi:hypothetical protein
MAIFLEMVDVNRHCSHELMAVAVLLEQRHESLVSPQPCAYYVRSVLKECGGIELCTWIAERAGLQVVVH